MKYKLASKKKDDMKAVTVYLGDLDIRIVQDEEALDGSNFSSAMRKIIREWARNIRDLEKQEPTD